MKPNNPFAKADLTGAPPAAALTMVRSPETLNKAIDFMDLEGSIRYSIRDTSGDGKADTMCNIALWDWSRLMGAEIPHHVNDSGDPQEPGAKGSRELSANNTARWLEMHGSRFGWVLASRTVARLYALAGKPACVTWVNPTGKSGHVAMLRGNQPDPSVTRIAQAGSKIFSDGTLAQGFGSVAPLAYWVHE